MIFTKDYNLKELKQLSFGFAIVSLLLLAFPEYLNIEKEYKLVIFCIDAIYALTFAAFTIMKKNKI